MSPFDDLLCTVAGQPLHALVEDENVSLCIYNNDTIHGALDHFLEEGAGFLDLSFQTNPLRNVPGGLHDLDNVTCLIINRPDSDDVIEGLSIFIFIFLDITHGPFLPNLIQIVVQPTRDVIIPAWTADAMPNIVAGFADDLFPGESEFLEKGAIDSGDGFVQIDHHEPIGQGIEKNLGFLFDLFLKLVPSFLKAGPLPIGSNKIP